MRCSCMLLVWLAIMAVCRHADADSSPSPFPFADGDRVVLLGDGLIEQEQYFGWIETALTTAFAEKSLTFRNLGWSADTPRGDSRLGLSLVQAGHEPAGEGRRLLEAQLELTKPSVLIIGYGMANSLADGAQGLDAFKADYQQLLDAARRISPEVRFILLSPLQRSEGTAAQRQSLEQYSQAVQQLAEQNQARFVDLSNVALEDRYRKDAIHLNEQGYRQVAATIIDALAPGRQQWQHSPHTEALRKVILRKNVWWFHRSRPANMAYVFGFRKGEQGQNAVEIPQFDALVAEEETRIAKLRALQPVEIEAPEPALASKYAEFTPQPTPEFTVADGWEVTLWAENPQLNKPIHMNFDPQGRLWVASSEAYPMIEVGQSNPDKVLVLEDTNGDGQADKSTTFADGLLIPTGIVPGDGGVYVAQSTDLLFLQDTDGDGQADQRRRVLSGFGTEDTHHNLHTLQWGPDGRLYMNQSVYTRTDAETPRGVVRLRGGGGFRFDTRSMRMQIFFRGLWNPWGHQFDAFGQSFMTDGAGYEGLAWVFPGAAFHPTPHARRLMDLISPGHYPKFASAEIVYGPSFPPDWQGSIITCDFRANRVTRFSLSDQGAGYVTAQEADLLRTAASTFRPIDVKQGPDGALYIADWSNPIINHGEVDFRDPRRDRWHGRIWRVRWTGAKTHPITDLNSLTTAQLLDNLLSDDRYTRDQSRRVLIERPQVSDELAPWAEGQTQPTARLQALWLSQAIGQKDEALLDELLEAEVPTVRAAAVRVLSDWADPASDLEEPIGVAEALSRFEKRVHDENPRVRLEAVRGLANFGTAQAVRIALDALHQPMDGFLDFALAQLVDDTSVAVMADIEAGRWPVDDAAAAKRLEYVLTAVEPATAQRFLSGYVSKHPLAADGAGPWIELIGRAGGPNELNALLDQAAGDGFQEAAMVRALQALTEAERLRKQRPSRELDAIGGLLSHDSQPVRNAAIALAGAWKLESQVSSLATIAADNQAALPSQQAAIEALRGIGGPAAVKALHALATNPDVQPIRSEAIVALAALDIRQAAPLFYDWIGNEDEAATAVALWRGMLANAEAGKILASAVPAEGISPAAAQAGLQVAKEGGREEPELLAALMPHAGQPMEAEKLTPQRVAQLIEQVQRDGDPRRGEAVYRREKLQCVLCHAIGGVGGHVGPDITSLGASAPVDYIIESLFDPNAKVKEGFHSLVVATEDGQVVTGVLAESTERELVLRSATDQLIRIPAADVIAQKNGPSLMPSGVIDRLKPEEQIDLIRFLTELGKPGAFDAGQGGAARTFELLAGTHTIEQAGADRVIDGKHNEGWQRLNTRVDGSVTDTALQELTQQHGFGTLVNIYLRTGFTVGKAGKVSLSVESPKPVAMWIDGKAIELSASSQAATVELASGEHTVLLRWDARDLPEKFILHSKDVTFATE